MYRAKSFGKSLKTWYFAGGYGTIGYNRFHLQKGLVIKMETLFKNTAWKYLEQSGDLSPFLPFPKAEDRKAWEALPAHLRGLLISQGEQYLHYDYPVLRATDFMAFGRTGNRISYEEPYFAGRYALNSLVLAECAEHQGRFLDDIVNGIFFLCEASAWQLPAHNSYGPGGSALLPDNTRPVLDLFACETGCQLACICYLLAGELDGISPFIVKRIRSELQQRIIRPYLTEHFWWMGTPGKAACNWTPWCTQNVLLTAFLTETDESVLEPTFLKAAESLDYFVNDYGEDGCCDEGAQYYRHAGLCLDGAAHILNQVSGGAFTELLRWNKIKNIAAYILNVHVRDKYYFNFADCSPIAGRAGVREYLFGKHTCQKDLMYFAAKDFQQSSEAVFSDESLLLNLYYRLETCFCYEEIRALPTEAPVRHRDIFYPSVGLFLAHSSSFDLAVKAGDNDDSHNHNDTGSLTLYKDGEPVLVDIGVESYTRKTFSPQRYEIWTMQSCYHNLPAIGGIDQQAGADYRAVNVKTSLAEPSPSISMELASAYPLEHLAPSCRELSYVRQVCLSKDEDSVILRDTLSCTGEAPEIILHFITYAKPEVSGCSIRIGGARAEFSGARYLSTEVLPITDKRLQTAWERDLYRICLKMEGSVFEMILR